MAKWTEEDVALLCEQYPIVGANIPELLGTYRRGSIYAKARSLGLRRGVREGGWTAQEDEILLKYYAHEGDAVVDKLPGRSIVAIRGRAQRIGLHQVFQRFWTPEENQILEENYTKMSAEELTALLPGRSEMAIFIQARKLGKSKANRLWVDRRDSDILGARYVGFGYCCVVCSVCGRPFLVPVVEAETFSHATEPMPVPDGWAWSSSAKELIRKAAEGSAK